MTVSFGKVAHAPGASPSDTTATYVAEVGERKYTFDRPNAYMFELIRVTKRGDAFDPPQSVGEGAPEKSYLTDPDYSIAEGIPEVVKERIRRYADENCADDVDGDMLTFETTLRKQ